ncbi:cupin domain-containing protein [Lacrimispora sp. 210928-DFI.3.58]|uniref:cupin domain-containing protein n=1 Tax=Lacrimispora sp. 210928-DFI.3.58 TaxID=2883214 RepID=UPI0015B43992|nr:cupin domain-containing protein [Lacrimispora sp. 210928-DFI.3.58]MCB7317475.1 cupin domain-containing protein [Lacrimispora sp. 210928-DFI.3.58]
MIRQASELLHTEADFKAAGLGEGVLELTHILNGAGELNGAGRIFAHASLPVGAWVGPHAHVGEREIYYYLKGSGEYYDDGRIIEVGPGCMTQVEPGQKHGLKNTGNGPLQYICLILYE